MHIDFIDLTTVKEIKLSAEWHLKQSKKLMRTFYAEFSRQEKYRAETCKEGKATSLIKEFAMSYLYTQNHTDYKQVFFDEKINTIIHNRPSTYTLLRINSPRSNIFISTKPYYNTYFVSWYLKKNWEKFVRNFIEWELNEHNT